ncbi:hypothetical protein CPB86DRAFT_732168 [Serendipita vermifera]|nr:hypothetical protein CPB86DRAFT_732168 [Serendipita vermifera]
MHSVAQRMDFPHHHAHNHGSHHHHGNNPRRHNTTTALDTQGLNDMNQPTHIRVNSLSSKGSLSDYSTILRTPQDSVQSENDALIVKQADDNTSGSGAWKPSMTLVKETLTSSPVEEVFSGLSSNVRGGNSKPMSMQINTSFPTRARNVPFSAHPNQRSITTNTTTTASSQMPAPQSATAAFPPMQLPTVSTSTNNANMTNNVTRSSMRTAEVKLPDVPPSHHPTQGQHRRTQSAPLLSLSPITATVSTPAAEAPNPITSSPPNNYGVNASRASYTQPDILSLQQPTAYSQIQPMTQAAAPFPSFPTLNTFPTAAAMPGVPQPAQPAIMWPTPFYPPNQGNFYTPRPAPQMGSPIANLATMVNNAPYSSPPVTTTAPTTQWKINPNSQPQMPLSHLISQAQGLAIGGPSAHNRKIGLYKTEICRNWEEKQSCRYGVKCQFAHGANDLRTVPRHPKYKTEICRTFWVTGSCPYGKRCCFIHPTAMNQGQALNLPLSGGNNMSPNTPPDMNNGFNQSDDNDRETQHTISLLARLDIKRNSPDGTNGNSRHTPDSNASDPSGGFIYPQA